MVDEVKQNESETSVALTTVDTTALNKESYEIINKVINETDVEKTKDLTYLFNQNQNKKTMVRVNKLNELLDVITDQAINRFSSKPDNISNQELLQGLKVVQDIIERGQNQVSGVTDKPLIQINQQNNELNVGGTPENMSKESRERIRNAVLGLLGNIQNQARPTEVVNEQQENLESEEVVIEDGN